MSWSPSEQIELERAFVATSYLLGRRGAELLEPLPTPSIAAQQLVQRLGHPDRNARAEQLAAELARIAASLEQWRLK